MAQSAATLAKKPALNRREWPRYTAEKAFALAANVDGKVVPCTILDVSLGGAKLQFEGSAPAGTAIALSHAEGESVICAEVWRRDNQVGIEFDFSEDSLGLISVCIRNMIDLDHQPSITD